MAPSEPCRRARPQQLIKAFTEQAAQAAGRGVEIRPYLLDVSYQSLMIPAEDPTYGHLGQAFPPWPAPPTGAILQPPRPEIPPSERILERATDRDLDFEAGD